MSMKNFIIFFLLAAAKKTHAEDLSHGGEGTNVELSKGYQFSALMDGTGKPAGQAYAYLGGKLTQVPGTNAYIADGLTCTGSTCPNAVPPPSTSLMDNVTAVSYFSAGVIAALSLWYVASSLIIPASRRALMGSSEDEDSTTGSGVPVKSLSEKAKSRRRREVQKIDAQMTRLAEIVLSAVESGECLQRSICLLGSQMSERKGKIADNLLSVLLPSSVQQSDYYIVLKKALRGQISCERLGCRH